MEEAKKRAEAAVAEKNAAEQQLTLALQENETLEYAF